MKRLSAVLLVGAMCLFAVGCGGGGNPSTVALKYYEAIANQDGEALGKYATPETVQSVGPILSKAAPMVAALGKISVVSQKIDGDNAVVVLKAENDDDDQEVNLVKIDGKWKVHDPITSGSGK